ncbi:hypothetical protein ACIQZB_00155 [Streptomyces sp. NPDC097727]|uniref:glycine-rich domain-containing protein n=1 Tax=Streptomyces sp. NPDC097727 TaxID=3366092 RepID=UPI0037F9A1D4
MSPVANVCACGEYFHVDDTGELCLNKGTMGLRRMVQFSTPGTAKFRKADYPWLARVRVKVQAGGGGSAGADAAAKQLIARPGGSGGGYAESLIEVGALADVESVVIGAGGAGGIGNNPGAPGGASSFGGTVTAIGGNPGTDGMTSGTSNTTSNGISAPSSGAGQITSGGGPGEGALRMAMRGMSGRGGDSWLGFGGYGRTTSGPGGTSRGRGGGAGGAFSSDGKSYDGGAGGNGIVIIELFG